MALPVRVPWDGLAAIWTCVPSPNAARAEVASEQANLDKVIVKNRLPCSHCVRSSIERHLNPVDLDQVAAEDGLAKGRGQHIISQALKG